MIPQEKSEAVARALRETFGVAEFEEIGAMKKVQALVLVFRIVVRGTPYLLRIILRKDGPERHYVNMRAAAEAGIAPRVWYTSVPDKISITDFVEAVPFSTGEARVRIPVALRTLHGLAPFAPVPHHINTTCMFLMNKSPALDGFVVKFREANLLPKAETEELFARLAQLEAAYPRREADMVSSHNDLKPENLVFDGRRAWLVDWEAAFWNDRYNDLAVMANFIAGDEAEELAYLREYFGRAPSEYELARFYVMQQIVHLFYTMGYMLIGSMGGGVVDGTGEAPEFAAFHRQLWAQEIDLRDPGNKILYGRVHWRRFLENMQRGRLEEALRVVSGGPRGD